MFYRAVPPLETGCTVFANCQEAFGQTSTFPCLQTVEALAHRHRGSGRHALAGDLRKLLCESVRFIAL